MIREQTSRRLKLLRDYALPVIAVLLALVFPARTLFILVTSGSAALSTDYIAYAPIINRVLNGQETFVGVLRDAFLVNGHSTLFPLLTEIVSARLTHWNAYTVLYFGLGFTLIKLALLFDLFASPLQHPRKWLLLPLLSALTFSASQVNVHMYGFGILPVGYCELGMVLGAWGLTRFRGKTIGLIWMILGGVLASWSYAAGLMTWPTFLVGMLVAGGWQRRHYAAWFLGTAAAGSVYLYPILALPVASPLGIQPLIRPLILIQHIGWPLASSFSQRAALIAGGVGISLLAAAGGLIARNRKTVSWSSLAPSLMLITHSLLGVALISITRALIAPWYTPIQMTFWFGIVGLITAPPQTRSEAAGRLGEYRLPFVWKALSAGVVVVLYVMSNTTYVDKQMFYSGRTPTAASCLLYYRFNAPYCEGQVFRWEVGNPYILPEMGSGLERDQLSVFAPRQEWTLQGDFAFDVVATHEVYGVPEITWMADRTDGLRSWETFEHLNLFLAAPNSVSWTVAIPDSVESATFQTAAAMRDDAPITLDSDGMGFAVSIQASGSSPAQVASLHLDRPDHRWHPITIPLERYAGQVITFTLSTASGFTREGDWGLFRYPTIELVYPPGADTSPDSVVVPYRVPELHQNDARLDTTDIGLWDVSGATYSTSYLGGSLFTLDPIPSTASVTFRQPPRLCLADYSHLSLQAAAEWVIHPQALTITLFGEDLGTPSERTIHLSFPSTNMPYSISYPLKLLELPQGTVLTGFRMAPGAFDPVLIEGYKELAHPYFTLIDVRFNRLAGADYCR